MSAAVCVQHAREAMHLGSKCWKELRLVRPAQLLRVLDRPRDMQWGQVTSVGSKSVCNVLHLRMNKQPKQGHAPRPDVPSARLVGGKG